MKNKNTFPSMMLVRIIIFFFIFIGCLLGFYFDIPILQFASGVLLAGYVPGFVLIKVLFPRSNDLSPIEKVVLTITFSLLISMILSLVLNLFPSGLSYWNILLSLGGIIFLLLIVSIIQDRHLLLNERITGFHNKPAYSILIPVITLSTAFLVLGLFKIDRTVDYLEFSIETAKYGVVHDNGSEEFHVEFLVQNDTEYDGLYKVNCLSEGNSIATTNPVVVNSGDSKTVSLVILLDDPGKRLEFLLIDADTNITITRLWYQSR